MALVAVRPFHRASTKKQYSCTNEVIFFGRGKPLDAKTFDANVRCHHNINAPANRFKEIKLPPLGDRKCGKMPPMNVEVHTAAEQVKGMAVAS
jgi:hypothetical protein